jgi:sortase A
MRPTGASLFVGLVSELVERGHCTTGPTVGAVDTDATVDGVPIEDPAASAATPAVTSPRPPDISAPRGVALARRFAEQLVAEAIESRHHPGAPAADPVVDWNAIWASADGTASPERAAGRIALAAGRVARTISGPAEVLEVGSDVSIAPTTVTQRLSGTKSLSGTQRLSGRASPPGLAPPDRTVVPAPAPPLVFPLPQSPRPSPPGAGLGETPVGLQPPAVPGTEAGGDRPSRRRRRRRRRVLAWVGTIVAIVVFFAAWQIWCTALVEHHSQGELASQFHRDTDTARGVRRVGLIAGTNRVRQAQGSVTARIEIPTIGVDQYVVEGTASGDLEKGPGHYLGTAAPGQAGNVAIAGHRTIFGAPFGRLGDLGPGALITLTTTAGQRLVYAVSETARTVPATDVTILNDFGDDRLTLTTSDPKYWSAGRLVVVARLEPRSAPASPGAPVPPAGPPPGPLADARTASWHLNGLPLAALVTILLVVLGLAYRPLSRRRRLLTILVAVPVWIVGIAVLFVALTAVLPPTL